MVRPIANTKAKSTIAMVDTADERCQHGLGASLVAAGNEGWLLLMRGWLGSVRTACGIR